MERQLLGKAARRPNGMPGSTLEPDSETRNQDIASPERKTMHPMANRGWIRSGWVALLLAGIISGNVVTAQGIKLLSFQKATLFAAMKQVHANSKADILFTDKGTETKTFEVASGEPRTVISSVAEKYGQETVALGKVYILRDALPGGKSLKERRDALWDYMNANLPSRSDSEKPDHFWTISKRMEQSIRNLHQQLKPGDNSFNNLTPAQQQALLEYLRYQQIAGSLGNLDGIVHPDLPG